YECRICYNMCLYFFFQAEDGIRDRNVTGVQTCALPIFCIFKRKRMGQTNLEKIQIMKACFMGLGYIGLPTAIIAAGSGIQVIGRSEERRVGKECSCGVGREAGRTEEDEEAVVLKMRRRR